MHPYASVYTHTHKLYGWKEGWMNNWLRRKKEAGDVTEGCFEEELRKGEGN